MTVDDVEQLRSIASSANDDDYGLRSLIRRLVMSELFKQRSERRCQSFKTSSRKTVWRVKVSPQREGAQTPLLRTLLRASAKKLPFTIRMLWRNSGNRGFERRVWKDIFTP